MNYEILLFIVLGFLILTIAVFSLLYKKKYENNQLYFIKSKWILTGIVAGLILGLLVGFIIGNIILGSAICLVICIIIGVYLQSKYGKKVKLSLGEIEQRLFLAKIILFCSIVFAIIFFLMLVFY